MACPALTPEQVRWEIPVMQIFFLLACGDRARGVKGIEFRPNGQLVVDRTRLLMRERLAEYAAEDAAKVANHG